MYAFPYKHVQTSYISVLTRCIISGSFNKKNYLQINVVARDNRNPEQTDRTQVIFTVEIDEFVPDYGITPDPNYGLPLYRVSIPETEGVNTCFYRVEAQDLDLRVSL